MSVGTYFRLQHAWTSARRSIYRIDPGGGGDSGGSILTSIKRAPKQRSETLELGQPQLRLISEKSHCSHISATSARVSGLFPPSWAKKTRPKR